MAKLAPTQRKGGIVNAGGTYELRVTYRGQRRKLLPRCRVKCGCCDQSVDIYYGDGGLEIGGVDGSIANWREVLLPLLDIQQTKHCFTDTRRASARGKKRRK